MGSLRRTRWNTGGRLLGRTTYAMLWPGWSKQTTGDGPGPILNRMHKVVVSATLEAAPWKESTIIGFITGAEADRRLAPQYRLFSFAGAPVYRVAATVGPHALSDTHGMRPAASLLFGLNLGQTLAIIGITCDIVSMSCRTALRVPCAASGSRGKVALFIAGHRSV